jgi:protein-tyrosine phosphatase
LQFIDIHFHILPEVDDGPKNLQQALEMARVALAEGISTIIATPHPDFDKGVGGLEETTRLVDEFRGQLLKAGIIGLNIVAGTEAYLEPDVLERLEKNQLITLNSSRYLLLEFPPINAPINIENFIFLIRNAGYVPVIAHPERYRYVQDNPECLANLVRLGCLSQVTAGAVWGKFGKRCQKTAEILIRHNLCHLLASDAHNPDVRPPGFSLCIPELERLAGVGAAEKYLFEVPGYILNNELYEPGSPEKIKSQTVWKFW